MAHLSARSTKSTTEAGGSDNLIDLQADVSADPRPKSTDLSYFMSLYSAYNSGGCPQNSPTANPVSALSRNNGFQCQQAYLDANQHVKLQHLPSGLSKPSYRPPLAAVRFSSALDTSSATPYTVIRPSSSYPSLQHLRSVSNMHRHNLPALDLVDSFRKETMDRLHKSGNLIDLGAPKKVIDMENFDISYLDPLRHHSVSSDSSNERSSPDRHAGESSFDTWERFDDVVLSARNNEKSRDEGISCEDEVDAELVAQSETTVKDSTWNSKLTITSVKSENESLRSFFRMVYRLHRDFLFDDELTNLGYIRAPMVEEFQRDFSGTIRVNVLHKQSGKTVSFDCDVQTSIEHATSQVLFELKGDQATLMQINRYIFRIFGRMDCLAGESPFSDYQQVLHCLQKGLPLDLILLDLNDHNGMRRTLEDDQRPFSLDDLAKRPKDPSREDVVILVDVFEKEVDRFTKAVKESRFAELSYPAVLQSIKAICSKLRFMEPQFLTSAVEKLFVFQHVTCAKTGRFSTDVLLEELDDILRAIRSAVIRLFNLYASTFRLPFSIEKKVEKTRGRQEVITVLDPVRIYLDSIHAPIADWKTDYSNIFMTCSLTYGQDELHVQVRTPEIQITDSFFPKLAFEDWIEFRSISICSLPREAKVVFALYGTKALKEDVPVDTATPELLGWASMFLFDCDWDISASATCHLVQGDKMLGLWRSEPVVQEGPAASALADVSSPTLWITMPEYENDIIFPAVLHSSSYAMKRDFDSLKDDMQMRIQELLEKDMLYKMMQCDKDIIWANRHYLHSFPAALPRILESAPGWDWASLAEIYAMLDNWPQLGPVDALTLLLNMFPDEEVRRYAVNCIRQSSTEALLRFLPQLVQAIRFQNYDANALTKFLLESALHNINVAHDLYWSLKENIHCPKMGYRYRLVLNALLNLSGNAMRNNFKCQESFVSTLTDVARIVKGSKDSTRNTTMEYALQAAQKFLVENGPVVLPISAAWKVAAVDPSLCCYFPSLNVPIKLSFKSIDEDTDLMHDPLIHVIYKCGDDLRQDQLAMQLIRVMDKMWMQNGIDLRMITFTVRQTDTNRGFIEAINNAETLRKIQVQHGVTGAFKDKPLASWLLKHNPSETEFRKAAENFSRSCAGYCVATYVLGACDRHSDNIMITHFGHMFHIDFGKFLGDAQMFGAIKRDRAPFVLTSDMVYLINGGDKPSIQFQEFVDLCCQAFNVLRRNGNTLITLFELMVYSGIPGVTRDASKYVQRALMMELNDAEATASFTRLIEESVKSWFTQFNFFLHNLAQMRFSADNTRGQMLSFASKAYSQKTEAKIVDVDCFGHQKRFNPQKCYVYIFKVMRENQREPNMIFRSFREVCELYEKLCMMYPSAKLYPLSKGVHVGRTNVKNVAEKRQREIQLFVQSLMAQPDDICHCDLVYTFFHVFARDTNDMQVDKRALESVSSINEDMIPMSPKMRGLVKLSIHYKENQGLCVLVNHAKDLYCPDGGAPDPYVKTYLYPDKDRATKRKTKVVRKTRHPTFNEMLTYRLPLADVKYRVLKVTVWNYDRFKENLFLGGVAINLESLDLTKEVVNWYSLGSAK